jgi:hypothetical protein
MTEQPKDLDTLAKVREDLRWLAEFGGFGEEFSNMLYGYAERVHHLIPEQAEPVSPSRGGGEPDYREFSERIIRSFWESSTTDEGIWDDALACGVVVKSPEPFDPEKHSDASGLMEPGDDYYTLAKPKPQPPTDGLREAMLDLACDIHMAGRTYNRMGEPESPGEVAQELSKKVDAALAATQPEARDEEVGLSIRERLGRAVDELVHAQVGMKARGAVGDELCIDVIGSARAIVGGLLYNREFDLARKEPKAPDEEVAS